MAIPALRGRLKSQGVGRVSVTGGSGDALPLPEAGRGPLLSCALGKRPQAAAAQKAALQCFSPNPGGFAERQVLIPAERRPQRFPGAEPPRAASPRHPNSWGGDTAQLPGETKLNCKRQYQESPGEPSMSPGPSLPDPASASPRHHLLSD